MSLNIKNISKTYRKICFTNHYVAWGARKNSFSKSNETLSLSWDELRYECDPMDRQTKWKVPHLRLKTGPWFFRLILTTRNNLCGKCSALQWWPRLRKSFSTDLSESVPAWTPLFVCWAGSSFSWLGRRQRALNLWVIPSTFYQYCLPWTDVWVFPLVTSIWYPYRSLTETDGNNNVKRLATTFHISLQSIDRSPKVRQCSWEC